MRSLFIPVKIAPLVYLITLVGAAPSALFGAGQ